MAVDLTVRMPDQPGQLARMGELLGENGINIEGMCGLTDAGEGEVHIAVEDGATAQRILEDNGIDVVADWDVVIVGCDDAPGELGRLARKVAEAGVNLTIAYMGTGTRVVLGGDDIAKLREAVA